MKRALSFILPILASYMIFEVYVLLRPEDLTDKLEEWLATTHGRFEEFYAEWRNRERSADTDAPAPLGD